MCIIKIRGLFIFLDHEISNKGIFFFMIHYFADQFKKSTLHKKINSIAAVRNFIADGQRGRNLTIDDGITELPSLMCLYIFYPHIQRCTKEFKRFEIGNLTFEFKCITLYKF